MSLCECWFWHSNLNFGVDDDKYDGNNDNNDNPIDNYDNYYLNSKLRIKDLLNICYSILEALFLHLKYVGDNGYYFDNGYD